MSSAKGRRFVPCLDGGLEARIALSHAMATIHVAAKQAPKTVDLGTVSPGRSFTFTGTLKKGETVFYRFRLGQREIFGATATGLTSDSKLLLLDSKRATLGKYSNGKGGSFLYTFQPGVYYARILGSAKTSSHYKIVLTSKPIPTTPSPPSEETPPVASDTLATFAQALTGAIDYSIRQFGYDVAIAENETPTIGRDRIVGELVQLATAYDNHEQVKALAYVQAIGQTMLAELQVAAYYSFPASTVLLASPGILPYLQRLAVLKRWNSALVSFIQQQTTTKLSADASSVLNTGVIAPSSQQSPAPSFIPTSQLDPLAYNSTPDLDSLKDYYYRHQVGLESAADYYYSHYDYSGYRTFAD